MIVNSEAVYTLMKLCRWMENPNAPERVASVYGFTALHGRQVLDELAALAAEVKRLKEIPVEMLIDLNLWWAFGSGQEHTHTWHTKQDFLERWRAKLKEPTHER
jgi:hypothetical protein